MRRLLLLGLSALALTVCIAGCAPEKEKEDESPDSISVGPASPDVVLGSSLQLTATAHFADGSTQDVTDLAAWSTNTAAIATVVDGLVTTLSTGDVMISASYDLRNASALVDVLVPPPAPGFVEVEPNDSYAEANDIGAETAFSGNCSVDIDGFPTVDIFSAVLNSGDYLVTLTWNEGAAEPYNDLDLILETSDAFLGSDESVPADGMPDSPAEATATLTTATTMFIDVVCYSGVGVPYTGTLAPQ